MLNLVYEVVNKAGGVSKLALKTKVKPQSVVSWCKKGYFPLEQIPKIVDEFGVSEKDCINAYRDFKKLKETNSGCLKND